MTSLGLVVARFYPELAATMEERAEELLADRDAEVVERVSVPGVFECPIASPAGTTSTRSPFSGP